MIISTKSAQEREELKDKARKKIQLLLNYGFIILSTDNQEQTSSNDIANELENNEQFILTIPSDTSLCVKASDMTLKLLKPYLKDLLVISQKATKTNYLLFNYNEDIASQLAPLSESNDDIQLIDTFRLHFSKFTLPTYTNKASLYSAISAPILTKKQIDKVLELHEKIVANQDSYFLLSNNVSLNYNMPMTLLRLLGENVIPLKALNVLELVLIYATNSSAIYRQANDTIKGFAIPLDFLQHEDFDLNQSEEEILSSITELNKIGLINSFKILEDILYIDSNIIVKSIKQYSYKQPLGYYRNLNLHQQDYVYTFLNLIRYIKNISHKKIKKDNTWNETSTVVKAEKLTITLEGLMYNLELNEYLHDRSRLASILSNLLDLGVREKLLIQPRNPMLPQGNELVKYLLTNRDKLHEFFILNSNEEEREDLSKVSSFYAPVSVQGRTTLVQR